MSKNTKIEWADHTFNPWIGCTKVGPGCDNCYAKADFEDRRHRVAWGAGQARSRTKTWGDPVKWNKEPFYQCLSCGWRGSGRDSKACEHGYDYPHRHCPNCNTTESLSPARARVFCASLADVFDNEVPMQWRADLLDLIAQTPNLDWLLLTKRIGNAAEMISDALIELGNGTNGLLDSWPWTNVWIGATIVTQEEADRDIPKLLAVPAAKRFLSMEPLLGPVSLRWLAAWPENAPTTAQKPGGTTDHLDGLRRLDWVIVGGESGPNARPMHPDWARSLRDQCEAAGVPFLFKQWGEWRPPYGSGDPWELFQEKHDPRRDVTLCGSAVMTRVGKKAAGRLLDGREWNGVPT